MLPKFVYLQRDDGTSEFVEFMLGLPLKDRAKLAEIIVKTEKYGLVEASKNEWVKPIIGYNNLFELRSKRANNIQRALYFHEVDNQYIITHGFTKKTQKTPLREIKHAIKLRHTYLKTDDK